jgi:hypothetical protein
VNWSFFRKKSELERRLEAYQPYAAPFPGAAIGLGIEQCEKNLRYLLDNKVHRLTVLAELLRHWHVDINNRADIEALLASLDSWVLKEWPALYEKDLADRDTWRRSLKSGRYIVFSLLIDVAILLGELIIERAPSCSWGLDLTQDSRDSPMESYKRPVLLIHGPNGEFRGVLDLESIVFGQYRNSKHFPAVGIKLFTRVVLESIHEAGNPWKDGVRI